MKNLFIKCECCGEALEISYDEELDSIELSIWTYGHNNVMGWRERLRWCWRILRTGNPWGDHVILTHQKMQEIINFYNSLKNTEKQLLKG